MTDDKQSNDSRIVVVTTASVDLMQWLQLRRDCDATAATTVRLDTIRPRFYGATTIRRSTTKSDIFIFFPAAVKWSADSPCAWNLGRLVVHYYAPAPRVGGIKRWCASDFCSLSVVYIGPKSRTERPRKTKIGTEVAHVRRDSDTTFKVNKSKVNLHGAGRGHILAASRTACY